MSYVNGPPTENCAIDGVDAADWDSTYGGATNGAELSLKFVSEGPYSRNVGSRTYLLDEDLTNYRIFNLLNKEFTFDVNDAELGCGLNGALYFVEMQADGGLGDYETNDAGAAYGTGYCDAQCPHDIKWINGEANMEVKTVVEIVELHTNVCKNFLQHDCLNMISRH